MKILVLTFLTLSFFCLKLDRCKKGTRNLGSKDKLCSCLATDDFENLKLEVNTFLKDLNDSDGNEKNFERIKNWLEEKPCIVEVGIAAGFTRTDPPSKEFIIQCKFPDGRKVRRVMDISVFSNRLSFNRIHG